MKFDKVVKAFRKYCQSRKNILYERHKFWSLKEEEGELVDAYSTRLKVQIADHCDYEREREGWPETVKTEINLCLGFKMTILKNVFYKKVTFR